MKANSVGEAGGEARRKFEHYSKQNRERNQRRNLLQKVLAKMLGVDSEDNRRVEIWHKGAVGEIAVGQFLDEIALKHNYFVLHDRAIPGSVANIDHILVTPFGVFVIDAKNYQGLIKVVNPPLFDISSSSILYVGNRKQTALINKMNKQINVVSEKLNAIESKIPVYGVLAFYGAEWPIFFKPTEIGGILINGKGIEAAILSKRTDISIAVGPIAKLLAESFKQK
jgi:hypothetical protein